MLERGKDFPHMVKCCLASTYRPRGAWGDWEFKFRVQDLTHLWGDPVSRLDMAGYVPVLGWRGGLG